MNRLKQNKLFKFKLRVALAVELSIYLRPTRAHYNHYVSPSVGPWSVNENTPNSLTTWDMYIITK